MHKKSFISFDGTTIIFREWLVAQAQGNIVIVHGAGEHSSRYGHVVEHFNALGFNAFTWDARGHGESGGQRGYVKDWEHFRQDIQHYFDAIRGSFADQPVFLLGHSLGGLKTLDYLLHQPQEDIRGYICSAPAIGKVGISPFLVGVSKVLTYLAPRLSLNTGLDHSAISRDRTWLASSAEDTLYHSRGTPRLAVQVFKTAAWVQSNADKLDCPILMIHGTADKICSIDGSREFIRNTTQADKTLLEYEGGYHELFNDIERQRVLSDVQKWIELRL